MRCSRPRHIGVTLIETFEQPSMRHADNRSSGKAVVMLLHSQRARLEQLAIGSGLRLLRSEPVGWMGCVTLSSASYISQWGLLR